MTEDALKEAANGEAELAAVVAKVCLTWWQNLLKF